MEKKGKKVTSMVLGIISIIVSSFWYISLPCGIIAIVLGAKSVQIDGNKIGKAGTITGIIGITLCILIYVTIILGFTFLA